MFCSSSTRWYRQQLCVISSSGWSGFIPGIEIQVMRSTPASAKRLAALKGVGLCEDRRAFLHHGPSAIAVAVVLREAMDAMEDAALNAQMGPDVEHRRLQSHIAI